MPVARTWGRVVVFDAVRVGHADGPDDPEERAAVPREASTLGIAGELVQALESMVEKDQEMKRLRIALVFGDQIRYQEPITS